MFINEHLAKSNDQLVCMAKNLRNEDRISSTWTRNCKIYIETNGSPEVAKIHHIAKQGDLSRLN